jgi:hypothetical protein
MKRAVVIALILAGCGTPRDGVPAPALDRENPDVIDIELPGPNVRFFCDGSVGVYVTEGSNGSGFDDTPKSPSSVSAVANHPNCRDGGS